LKLLSLIIGVAQPRHAVLWPDSESVLCIALIYIGFYFFQMLPVICFFAALWASSLAAPYGPHATVRVSFVSPPHSYSHGHDISPGNAIQWEFQLSLIFQELQQVTRVFWQVGRAKLYFRHNFHWTEHCVRQMIDNENMWSNFNKISKVFCLGNQFFNTCYFFPLAKFLYSEKITAFLNSSRQTYCCEWSPRLNSRWVFPATVPLPTECPFDCYWADRVARHPWRTRVGSPHRKIFRQPAQIFWPVPPRALPFVQHTAPTEPKSAHPENRQH
jgi:hypothetical protein